MTLHRLLGFGAAVPDPAALASFYAELGLGGDAVSGYRGSSGGGSVFIEDAPYRRLLSVEIGCTDERDLDEVEQKIKDGGGSARRNGGKVDVFDIASQVKFTVRIRPGIFDI